MKGLIQKYILPREIDFDRALQLQVNAARDTVLDLCRYCEEGDFRALRKIINDERQCHELKNSNMRELLNVFITPYDRESIYRTINQIDWIALSVKHLAIDMLVFKVRCPPGYRPVIDALSRMAAQLADGFTSLGNKHFREILDTVNRINADYDRAVEECARAAARHLEKDDIKVYLTHREILNQLKEVAKRIHIGANTLQDMAVKAV